MASDRSRRGRADGLARLARVAVVAVVGAGLCPALAASLPEAWLGSVTFRSEDRQTLDGSPENRSASLARTEVVATLLPGAASALVASRSTTRIDATETTTETLDCPAATPGTTAGATPGATPGATEAKAATRTVVQVMTQVVDGLAAGAVRVTPGAGRTYVVAIAAPRVNGGLTTIDSRTSGTGGCDGRGGPGLGPPRALTLQAFEEPPFQFKAEGTFDPAQPARAKGRVEVGDGVFEWDLVRRVPACDEVRRARAGIAERLAAARRDTLAAQARLGAQAAEAGAEVAATMARGGLHDGRGEDALAALDGATGALGLFDAADDAAFATALGTMVASPETQRALVVVGDAILLEPLPATESWLKTVHELRRLSAHLDALAALHGELGAACR